MWPFKKNQSPFQFPIEHHWEMIARSYAPIRKDIEKVMQLGLPPEILQKALCGVTTYLWEDSSTGETRKEEILGNDKDELSELLERVDTDGMQYIRSHNNVYAVAKWVPKDPISSVQIK